MLLHDAALREAIFSGVLGLDPFLPSRVQPSSIDLTLDRDFAIIDADRNRSHMDVRQNNSERAHHVHVSAELPAHHDYFLLRPEHFVLASTVEIVRMPDHLAGRIEGKSSLGRLGLMVHSTAGFIDPGFEGQITLELSNMLTVPIRLYPGMPIAQLAVMQMLAAAEVAYDKVGKYSGQRGPTTSQFHRNFNSNDS